MPFPSSNFSPRSLRRGLLPGALALLVAVASPVTAATFRVNGAADLPDAAPGDGLCAVVGSATCTLRAAVQETNALPGADRIEVPDLPERLRLSRSGAGEDLAATGDLDVLDILEIIGVGSEPTWIESDGGDRLFDVHPTAQLRLQGLVLTGGRVTAAGGAVRNAAVLEIEDTTLLGNGVSTAAGGAIANLGGATTLVRNSTLSGNAATPNGQGGGLANLPGGLVELDHVTLFGNLATAGGALHNLGDLELHGTILTNSPTGGNCGGQPPRSRGYNLDSGFSCRLAGPGDLEDTEAGLSALGDNGGATLTHGLVENSAAIDAGDPDDCPLTDQRGETRPADGNGDGTVRCDIGAFERIPPAPDTPTPTTTPTPTPSPPPSPTSPPTPRPARIQLAGASGFAGSRIPFEIRLFTGDREVIDVEVRIDLTPPALPIARNDLGRPLCSANPNLPKDLLAVFRPSGCQAEACTALDFVVFSGTSPKPRIPDDTVLGTCLVDIPADTPAGAYPLRIVRWELVDPFDATIPDVVPVNGEIVVRAQPTPTPSPTPTPTPVPCPGDCNGDGEVRINEVLLLVNIALGQASLDGCTPGDANRDGNITVNEIILAVNVALGSCPRP